MLFDSEAGREVVKVEGRTLWKADFGAEEGVSYRSCTVSHPHPYLCLRTGIISSRMCHNSRVCDTSKLLDEFCSVTHKNFHQASFR